MTDDMLKDTARFAWSLVAATAALLLSMAAARLATGASVDSLIHNAHKFWHIALLPVIAIGLPLLSWLDKRGILNLMTLLGASAFAGFIVAGALVLVMAPAWERAPFIGLVLAAGGACAGVCSALAGWLVWRLWPLTQSGKVAAQTAANPSEAKPCPTIRKP